MSLKTKFLKDLQKQYGYRANWLPSRPLRIGSVGRLSGGEYIHYYLPEHLGIHVEVSENVSDDVIEYKSNRSIQVTAKGRGNTGMAISGLSDGEAGFEVSFGGSRSVFLKTGKLTYQTIDNLGQVEQRIQELRQQGEWNDEYVIITELVDAKSGTFLISQGGDSKIQLKARADIGDKDLDIANADLGLSVVMEKGIGTKILAKTSLSPMFKVMAIDRRAGMLKGGERGGKGNGHLLTDIPFEESQLALE